MDQLLPQKVPYVEPLTSLVDTGDTGSELFLSLRISIRDVPVTGDNAARKIADCLQAFVDELRKNLGD